VAGLAIATWVKLLLGIAAAVVITSLCCPVSNIVRPGNDSKPKQQIC
jgi:hypothetical protein